MTKDEALKMAIEVMENIEIPYDKFAIKAIQACKEALEQPAQEPVAWIKAVEVLYIQSYKKDKRVTSQGWRTNLGLKPEPDDVPLYTHPAPSWQGLTDDEIEYWECLKAPPVHPDFLEDDSWHEFARCIEQALKEKNA